MVHLFKTKKDSNGYMLTSIKFCFLFDCSRSVYLLSAPEDDNRMKIVSLLAARLIYNWLVWKKKISVPYTINFRLVKPFLELVTDITRMQ